MVNMDQIARNCTVNLVRLRSLDLTAINTRTLVGVAVANIKNKYFSPQNNDRLRWPSPY